MVARSDTTIVSHPGAIAGWFRAWRRLLTIAVRTVRRAPGQLADGVRDGASSSVTAIREWISATLRSSRRRATEMTTRTARTVDEFADSIRWVFDGWRRVLARVGRFLAVPSRLARVRRVAGDVVAYLRNPGTLADLSAASIDSIAAFGVRALILGAVASIAVGWITSGAFGIAIARAAGALAWAAARLAILLALSPRGRSSHLRAFAAWACSLIPFMFGATEGLRLLTLVASAWLCLEGLIALGEDKRVAQTMVLWSFGGQASVIALGWLLRGGIAAIAALL